jgi:crotonobetainyl-CoA:carnitine CoA-transferase CaiB-like acyl-CoA transferase
VALATTDYLSSVYAAFGAVTAIHAAARTGKGQVVDVALYEAAFTQMEPVVPAYEKLGLVPQREGGEPALHGAQQPVPHARWRLGVDCGQQQPTWKRLVAMMQQPELLTDPRFETIQAAWQAREHEGDRRHHQRVVARL